MELGASIMKAVRFTAEGLINSFRIPQTSAHQLTYLVPTKTQITGLIASIMGKGEVDYYNLLRKIKVGIVPLKVDSLFTDAWTFRKWKEAGSGRDILTREKLYKSEYMVYISGDDGALSEIINALKNPLRIPSLGMDDELVLIKDVKEITLDERKNEHVHSIFRFQEGMRYFPKFNGASGMQIFPPRTVTVNLDFNENEIPRKPERFIQLVEFVGLYCELNSPMILYSDIEHNWNVEML